MPIKLDCPRCKRPLSVPTKKAGSYALCPECQGRFWIPPEAAQTASENVAPVAAGRITAPPVAAAPTKAEPPARTAAPPPVTAVSTPPASPTASPPPDKPAGNVARMIWPGAAASPTSAAASPATPQAPPAQPAQPAAPSPPVVKKPAADTAPPPLAPPGKAAPAPATPPPRKVARFITSEAADSTLKLADDGKLPELQLGDLPQSSAKQKEGSGSNPLVLFGLLSLSVVASLLLVMTPEEGPGGRQTTNKQQARQIIAEQYFSDLDQVPREPYQLLLREARLARSRGDYDVERQLYRRVLGMLREERGPRGAMKGVTGTLERDRILEEQLVILLSD